jgi:hypothetical protein
MSAGRTPPNQAERRTAKKSVAKGNWKPISGANRRRVPSAMATLATAMPKGSKELVDLVIFGTAGTGTDLYYGTYGIRIAALPDTYDL